MNNDNATVIESPRYATEAENLAKNPIVIRMAEEFKHGIDKGEVTVEWLSSFEAMQAANSMMESHNVSHESIGGPARAIRLLVTGKNS